MFNLNQNKFTSQLGVFITILIIFAAPAFAQQTVSSQSYHQKLQDWDQTYRPLIIQNVLNRIAAEADEKGFIHWREELQAHLEQLSTRQINKVQNAKNYNDVIRIIRGGEIASQTFAQSSEFTSLPQLGDPDQDLVYTPLPPCRIVDTRNRRGKFAANQTRFYSINGDTTSQGGKEDCEVPNGINEPAAVVLNITSTQGEGNGFLTAYPITTRRPEASVLNYQTADVANAVVLKSAIAGAHEIAVYASAATHVVIDVMGYLRKPNGTNLVAEINALKTQVNALKAAQPFTVSSSPVNSVGVGSSATEIRRVTISAPVAGQVAAIASGWLFEGTDGQAVNCGLMNSVVAPPPGAVFQWQSPTGADNSHLSASRVFDIAAGEVSTYYLVCLNLTSGATSRVFSPQITAIFTPAH